MADTPIVEILRRGYFRVPRKTAYNRGFEISGLPAKGHISLQAECVCVGECICIGRKLDKLDVSTSKISYTDVSENALELLAEVERVDPQFVTWLEEDLSEPRRRVLVESILLHGLHEIRDRNLIPFEKVLFEWVESSQSLTVSRNSDRGSTSGRALFISGLPCVDRISSMRDAFAGLPNADFQIVIANSRGVDDECILDLAVNQYLILIDLDTGRRRVFGHYGPIN